MMEYVSTRDNRVRVAASHAVMQGLSAEGGLFVPANMPWLSYDDILSLCGDSYPEQAAKLLARFFTDYTEDELRVCTRAAYTREKFGTDAIAPLYMLDKKLFALELWHGPTCAFKDMALQILPLLLKHAVRKSGEEKTVVILTATSGDTGKAALEGFKDVDGTKILVFYPEQGVSAMQKLQMATQEGGNVGVCAVRGNFDDAQNGVKTIFTDRALSDTLGRSGYFFSSANSINWGRLAPQIVYYVAAYCRLIKSEKIACGDFINVVVPTGNFGNILAAYYAKKIGIPIHRLICASNSNNVLTDFLRTGVYDRNRPFYTTISPSMDILISSNLERLLYDLSGCDDALVRELMESLRTTGRYEVPGSIRQSIADSFWAGCCDDEATRAEIRRIYKNFSYVVDPHTAVALDVYRQYVEKTGDTEATVVASTASPFKFAGDVLEAIDGVKREQSSFESLGELASVSMTSPPRALASLRDKPARFDTVCGRDEMKDYVLRSLGIR